MKKSDISRSHSWWWDSHINPKYSKWLQENIKEMDLKVNTMLKIIEEEADSFAKRAEMYYRRRPELLNLVEEFYRSYRALAERYNLVSGEIHRSFVSNVRMPLDTSHELSQASPMSLEYKRGVVDFDTLFASPISSLTGASEYDRDLEEYPSNKERKVASVKTEKRETSIAGIKSKFDTLRDSLYNELSSMQEDALKEKSEGQSREQNILEPRLNQLQKELHRLQEENRKLRENAPREVYSVKKLEAELFNIQKRENHETEERKRQKMEAENMKLSNTLINLQKEKIELIKLHERSKEDYEVVKKRMQEMEGEFVFLKQETRKAHLEASAGAERVRMLEDEGQRLQQALLILQTKKETAEKEFQKGQKMYEVAEQQMRDLQEKSANFGEESSKLKDLLLTEAARVKDLEEQLVEFRNAKKVMEDECIKNIKQVSRLQQGLCTSEKQELKLKKRLEIESEHVATLNMELQKLERSLQDSQFELHTSKEEHKLLEEQIRKLEEEIQHLQSENRKLENEGLGATAKTKTLEGELQETQKERKRLSDEVTFRMQQIIKLEEQVCHLNLKEIQLKKEQEEVAELIQKLQTDAQEVQIAKMAAMAESKMYADKCKVLESREVDLQNQIALKESETLKLQAEVSAHEELISQGELKVEELQGVIKTLNKEREALTQEFQRAKIQLEAAEDRGIQLEQQFNEKQDLVRKLTDDLSSELAHTKQLESNLCRFLQEKTSLEEREMQMQQSISRHKDEKLRLTAELSAGLISMEHLGKKCADLQSEVIALKVEIQQLKQAAANSETEYTTLSKQYQTLTTEHKIAKERLKKTEEELSLQISENKILQDANCAETDLIQRLEFQSEKLCQQLVDSQDENKLMACKNEQTLGQLVVVEQKVNQLDGKISQLQEENTMLKGRISTKANQIQDLEDQMSALSTEKESLVEAVSSRVEEISLLKKEIHTVQDENKSLQLEIESGTKKQISLEAEIQKLQEAVSKSKDEKAALINELERRMDKSKYFEKRMEDLQEELAAIKEEKLILSLELAARASQLRKIEEEIQILQGEKEALGNDLSSQITLAKKLDKEKNILMDENKNALTQLRNFSDNLRNDLSSQITLAKRLEEEKNVLMDENKNAATQLDKAKDELHSLQVENERKEMEITAGIKAMEKITAELAGLQDEKQNLGNKITSNIEKLNDLLGKVKNLQDKEGQLNLRIAALTEELRERNEELQNLRQQILEAEDKNRSLTEMFEMAREVSERRLIELQEEASYLQKENRQNKDELIMKAALGKKLEEEVSRLQSERTVLLEETQSHTKQFQELQEKHSRLQEQQERVCTHLQEKEHQVLMLEAQIQRVQHSMASLGEENAQLKGRIAKDTEEYALMKTRVSKMREQLSNLHGEQTSGADTTACRDIVKDFKNKNEERGALEDENLSKKCISLTEETREHSNMIEEVTEDISLLMDEIHNMQEVEIFRLQEAFVILLTENTSLKHSCEKWAGYHGLIEDQMKELRARFSDLQREKITIESEVETQNASLKKIEEELSAEQKENAELKDEIALKEIETHKLHQQVLQAQEKNQMLKNRVQAALEEIQILQSELQNLQQENNAVLQHHQKSLEELYIIGSQVKELQEEISLARDENSVLRGKASAGKAYTINLEDGVANLQQEKVDLDLAVASLKDQKFEMQKVVLRIQGERENLLDVLQLRNEQVLQMQTKVLDLHTAIFGLPLKDLALDDVGQSDKAQNPAYQQQIDELKMEFVRLQDAEEKLKMDVSSSDDYVFKLEEEVSSLKEEAKGLKYKLETGREEYDAMRNRIREIQETVSSLENERSHLQSKIAAQSESMTVLEATFSNLQGERSTLQQELTIRQRELSELNQEIQTLQNQYEVSTNKTFRARIEHSLTETKVRELQEELFHLQEENKKLKLMFATDSEGMRKPEENQHELREGKETFENQTETRDVKLENESKEKEQLVAPTSLESDAATEQESDRKAVLSREEEMLDAEECGETTREYQGQAMVLQQSISRLLEDNDGLRVEVLTGLESMERLEENASRLRSEIPALQNEKNGLHDQLDGLQREIRESQDQKKALSAQLEAKMEEEEQLEEEVVKLHELLLKVQREKQLGLAEDTKKMIEGVELGILEEEQVLEIEEKNVLENEIRFHANLGDRLHQESVDEKLEREVVELRKEQQKVTDGLQAGVEQLQKLDVEAGKVKELLSNLKNGRQASKFDRWRNTRYNAVQKKVQEVPEMAELLQDESRRTIEELRWDAEAAKRIESEVMEFVRKECGALSIDAWMEEAMKLQVEVERLQEACCKQKAVLESVKEGSETTMQEIEEAHRLLSKMQPPQPQPASPRSPLEQGQWRSLSWLRSPSKMKRVSRRIASILKKTRSPSPNGSPNFRSGPAARKRTGCCSCVAPRLA